MYGLDLFSGIGGLTKALEGYVYPAAYCENDRYAQAVLLSRMAARDLPVAPIWDDVQTLGYDDLPGPIDIIYGGFPCQDISVAGRGAGLGGKRSRLFFEIARLIGELRPQFVFLENVPAIRLRGGDAVVGELARLGYDCRWDVLSASDVGANHQRKRWWLLAYARHGGGRNFRVAEAGKNAPQKRCDYNDALSGSGEQPADVADANDSAGGGQSRQQQKVRSQVVGGMRSLGESALADTNRKGRSGPGQQSTGFESSSETVADSKGFAERPRLCQGESGRERLGRSGDSSSSGDVSDANRTGFRERRRSEPVKPERHPTQYAGERSEWWLTEPNVGRVAHGIPLRVDRLRALGNAVVPAQAREAFERLMGLK